MPTVLLIDDDNQSRPFYRLALERAAFRVVEAVGGLEGVRAYGSPQLRWSSATCSCPGWTGWRRCAS